MSKFYDQMNQQIEEARNVNWQVHSHMRSASSPDFLSNAVVIARPKIMTEYAPQEDGGIVSARYTLFELLVLQEFSDHGWHPAGKPQRHVVTCDRWMRQDNTLHQGEAGAYFASEIHEYLESRPLVAIGYFELLEDAYAAEPLGPLTLHQLMLYPEFRGAGLGLKSMKAVQQTAQLFARSGVENLQLQAFEPDLNNELVVYAGTARCHFYGQVLQVMGENHKAPHRLSFYEKCGFKLIEQSIHQLAYLDNAFFLMNFSEASLSNYIEDYCGERISPDNAAKVLKAIESQNLVGQRLSSETLWSMAKCDADAAAQRILDRAYYDADLNEDFYNTGYPKLIFQMIWPLSSIPGQRSDVGATFHGATLDREVEAILIEQIKEWSAPKKAYPRRQRTARIQPSEPQKDEDAMDVDQDDCLFAPYFPINLGTAK